MKARDVMTSEVVSIHPDMPTWKIAGLLLEHGISAVPVVDDQNVPLGMVSEGDLIGRRDGDREARRDWWLALLAEGSTLNEQFLASLRQHKGTAGEIMASPLVTVGEDTDVDEIARLLGTYRIKRVPVLRDGRIVGIVSRADLLRALAHPPPPAPAAAPKTGLLASAFAEIDEHFVHRRRPASSAHPQPDDQADPETDAGSLSVSDFRGLVADFERSKRERRENVRRAAVTQRKRKVAQLIDQHMSDDSWRSLVHQAREAAEHGEKEYMLLRFPSQLCSDGGRAINVTEPDWPATLRGEAAEIYLRWERNLRGHGFHLAARVLEFPDGKPGDVGLFLIWGE